MGCHCVLLIHGPATIGHGRGRTATLLSPLAARYAFPHRSEIHPRRLRGADWWLGRGRRTAFLGLVAGLDIRRPALKLPGLGRLGFPAWKEGRRRRQCAVLSASQRSRAVRPLKGDHAHRTKQAGHTTAIAPFEISQIPLHRNGRRHATYRKPSFLKLIQLPFPTMIWS